MMTIWKFEVPVEDEVSRMMPDGAKMLTVQMQDGRPQVWAMVDSERPQRPRRFAWRGTGHDTEDLAPAMYVGTVQLLRGAYPLVFHLFDRDR